MHLKGTTIHNCKFVNQIFLLATINFLSTVFFSNLQLFCVITSIGTCENNNYKVKAMKIN